MTKSDILNYASGKYGAVPENPWINDPESTVLRHKENGKWFGLLMKIKSEKIGFNDGGYIQILNVKCDPPLIDSLIDGNVYFKAYHMNRTHWLTIALDNASNDLEVYNLLSLSYDMTL